ncbi:M14 family zinc carboxypeptidase [Parapedobacter koreensis]|uniref:Zinc carboxypeptidase n=1 Tax=Parapedobacter koreensis TaxID=332977 RepID=A0A1H7U9D0_9SPHI|nr:M14 family zinc carboxypeptidase [Parapedobacter koreensis]SEL92887.1 Zinc carboxypeptidase [Parapedobacter koreensis]
MNRISRNGAVRWLLAAAICCSGGLAIGQPIDRAYNEKIRAYTTDARFLPSSVLDLVDDPAAPSPLDHFGEIIGAPGIMHNTTEIYGYFKALADHSPRVEMTRLGVSEEGRDMHLIVIADEQTIQQLAAYKARLAQLADPRKITREEAMAIIGKAKPVYYLNGGLHSPETGSPEMLMELAYRLATDTSQAIAAVRERVITVINPVSEPDGWDKMRDWYYRYSKQRTDWDDGMPARPPYWGKYVVHDNNRDGIQVTQELSKAAIRAYFEWYPTVFLDLHESVPLLYISTGTGPYNPDTDPVTVNEWQLLAQHEMTQLSAQGLPGVFTWAFFDGWHVEYLGWVANNHNSIGRFYETFGNAGANTFLRDLADGRYAGKPATAREWYRPDPATEKVLWSFRNNINYMQAGAIAALQYAATNGATLLENFYQKGVKAVEKGKTGSVKAFAIPAKQRDPAMAAYLVNQLLIQGIEVHQVTQGEGIGDYVVLLDQPYGPFAKTLLSKQQYPKDAEHPPYDDVAWTFGLLFGVDVQELAEPKYERANLQLLDKEVVHRGKVVGSGAYYYLPYKAQNTVLAALYWLQKQRPSASVALIEEDRVVPGGLDSIPAGSIVFEGISSDDATAIATAFGLDLVASASKVEARQRPVTLPRVAVYHSWAYTQDEGWTRYTLEQRGIPYTSINKDHLKAGNLREQFDVILVPRLRGGVTDFIHEIDRKYGPMPYTKTDEYPAHGFPDATDDITGGPGFEGVANLQAFAEQGGIIVTMDNSSMMVAGTGIGGELGVKPTSRLFHPGSVVQARVKQRGNPVFYGYPELFPVFRGNGPVLAVEKRYRQDMLLLQYGAQTAKVDEPYRGPILGLPAQENTPIEAATAVDASKYPYVLSGMVRNEDEIIGEGAIFDVPVGKGRLLAFTFDPLHRYQNHHDAPLVWNILINWDHLKASQ